MRVGRGRGESEGLDIVGVVETSAIGRGELKKGRAETSEHLTSRREGEVKTDLSDFAAQSNHILPVSHV